MSEIIRWNWKPWGKQWQRFSISVFYGFYRLSFALAPQSKNKEAYNKTSTTPAKRSSHGDGVNDTWKITGMENGHYQNTQIYIFNRYGKLLKQITAAGEGWNGLFNGEQVPASDYWYMMQLEDGRTIKGHFSLKR